MYDAVFDTKVGKLGLRLQQNMICGIDFDVTEDAFCSGYDVAIQTGKQIMGFLTHKQQNFKLPLYPQGTEFQLRVWRALQRIPYGETRTYGDLASQLNSSARAVGNACRRNPIPIIIPCHRIVAKTGIGGFSGQTEGFQIDRKQALLKLESED